MINTPQEAEMHLAVAPGETRHKTRIITNCVETFLENIQGKAFSEKELDDALVAIRAFALIRNMNGLAYTTRTERFCKCMNEKIGGHVNSSKSSCYCAWPLTLWSKMRAEVLLIVLIGSGVLLSGCMFVRGGNLQPPTTWPPASTAEKKALSLIVTAKPADESKAGSKRQQLLEGQAQKAYIESGLFSQVTLTKDPAALHANIEYLEEGNRALASISGFISGFTFGIIPGYAEATLSTVTTFEDQNGKELGSIRKSETCSFWIQLFLIAVMPFREEPQATARGIYYDLNRATIEQARMSGIL